MNDYITLTLKQRFMIGTPNALDTPRTHCQKHLLKKPLKNTQMYNPHLFTFLFRCKLIHVPKVWRFCLFIA